MNTLSRQCIAVTLGLAAFITIFGYVGSYEYAEQVCYTMPEEAYYTILDTLGEDATQKAIAAEYMENKDYYDNLNK